MATELPGDGADSIAIIGMAGRFPGAANVDAFWRNLRDGVESITFFSDAELLAQGLDRATLDDPAYVRSGGMLEGVELFDAEFFGLSPREAELTDPQHRLFLECAWTALEHAGQVPGQGEARIGVYAGTGLSAYLHNNLLTRPELLDSVSQVQLLMGNNKDYLPTRLSYKLDLRGPSLNVSTACSTSLVAVHLAVQSLLDYHCDLALAGGVGIQLPQDQGYRYTEGGIASPDGHCRPFDAQAQGTVSGNGVGVVVLKRLAEALADGDPIHGVIRGSAINNDGADKVGYTAPSVSGQSEVIAEALALAGLPPESIGYVEAHGTGTVLGDPIEVAALTRAFATHKRGYCALGSVKSNIGHLDEAAGVAGLIKTVLALEHGQLPPSLHYRQPNPQIDFAASPFYVNDRLQDWPHNGAPRRAGVSSFGIGGTNAHVVLEQAPAQPPSGPGRPWRLLSLSAREPAALAQRRADLATWLKTHPQASLDDVAHTLHQGRKRFSHRRALVCRDLREAVELLATPESEIRPAPQDPPPVAFLFSGQGSQHPGMAAGLYRDEPRFRAELDRCAQGLLLHLGQDLRPLLLEGRELTRTDLAQPALFALEYALAQVWLGWGVQPQALAGHSLGEYTAACLAGVFSLDTALALVAARGRLIQALPREGGMLAVPLSEAETLALLDGAGQLDLAAVNGPQRCVVSGPTTALAALEERLAARGLQAIPLATSHAFHSALLEPVLAAFRGTLAGLELRPPTLPLLSNLSGDWLTPEQATDPDYWVGHLRHTVRFGDNLARLLETPERVLLEIGPGHTLATLALAHPARQDQPVFHCLPHPQRPQADQAALLEALGGLWTAGVAIDWSAVYAGQNRRRLALPTYPFQRRRYWIDPPGTEAAPASTADPVADWFYLPAWRTLEPPPPADLPHRWLLFCDDCGLGDALAVRLQRDKRIVTRVTPGNRFQRLDADHYTLAPERAEDYAALLKDLDIAPDALVHLWTLGAPGTQEAERGFYSLLALTQALGGLDDRSRSLTVVSSHLHAVTDFDPPCPERSLVLGPVRVAPLEYPQLRCRSLDLEAQPLWDTDDTVARLLAECADPAGPALIAWRGGQRLEQHFEPAHWSRAGLPTRLRPGGVYLITGGLGSMGLAFAEYLHRRVNARLALLARRLPAGDTEDRRQRLQALEESGAEVLTLEADVADPIQLGAAVAQVMDRFGRLDGVLHTAGVLGQGLIHAKSRNQTEAVFAPKVRGVRLLAETVAPHRPDFLLLCGSLAAHRPIIGQVDYCAANAYLDAFAQATSRQGLPTIAVDWGFWQELGIIHKAHLDPAAKQAVLEDIRRQGLSQAGVEALERVLARATGPQVAISPEDFQKPSPPARSLDHPLLETHEDDGAGTVSYTARLDPGRHWLLTEHTVDGHALLPGTTYLELARAAYAHHVGAAAVELREVYFLAPFAPESPRELRVVLRRRGEGYAFHIISPVGEDRWLEHARGEVRTLDVAAPPNRDLDTLATGCNEDRGSVLPATGFGPRWDCLRRVRLGDGRGLAELELPPAHAAEAGNWPLHPALLDMATGFMTLAEAPQPYLPFHYQRLALRGPLPARLYSLGTRRHELCYDLTLLDAQGRELAVVEGYSLRRLRPAAVSRPRNLALDLASPGALHSLALRPAPRLDPGPGEVEIQVQVAGLNFIEVLYALGMLPRPPNLGPLPLGQECAGRISALGEGVTGLKVGDSVMAYAPGCFGLYLTAPAAWVAPRPPGLTPEQAATLPTAYITAWHALVQRGRLEAGETVLIHAAAGGLGLAAIEIAQRLGATIYATAGSESKREYLRAQGLAGVMDSRSLAFADEVLEATQGRGVDVLLNSLGGEFLIRGLDCLAPFGRFLEVGKRDVFANHRLPLGPFSKCLSFTVVDVGPEMPGFAALWAEVMDRCRAGELSPLPHRAFPMDRAVDAFEYMAQARHIGKVLLTVDDPETLWARADTATPAQPQGLPLAAILGDADPSPVTDPKPTLPGGHQRPELATPYAPPRNPTETTLAAIWGELLGLDRVGIHDDFFELKGDSLLAAQVASRVHRQLGVKLPLSALFEAPTVAGLGQRLERLSGSTQTELEEGEI